MQSTPIEPKRGLAFLLLTMMLSSAAAGMGWGIRGQYGHETGAMIAGSLTSLTLVLMFVPHVSSLSAARAAALMTVGIGIGGQMTYGQTVGLTHDGELIGNWEALRWGMLGLSVKGGIWIGFGSVFLGMGLSEKKYRSSEMIVIFVGMLVLLKVGIWLINSPYDPAERALPWIYFSDDWYFEPGRDLTPRRETWGGLAAALVGLTTYVRFVRGDRLAGRMAIVGMIAGGIGFPGGQCVQAYHAWNANVFTDGALGEYSEYFRYFNWWNMMETTFGCIFGAVLALGLWLNRRLIEPSGDDKCSIAPPAEIIFLMLHLVLLLSSEFLPTEPGSLLSLVELYTDSGILMSAIPIICIVGGRIWPYMLLLPTVAAPIVGKTFRNLVVQSEALAPVNGWSLLVELPMAFMFFGAVVLIWQQRNGHSARSFASIALTFSTLCYFRLNTLFFHGAWPWLEWTGRTPNQTIFIICAAMLLTAALVQGTKAGRTNALHPDGLT